MLKLPKAYALEPPEKYKTLVKILQHLFTKIVADNTIIYFFYVVMYTCIVHSYVYLY